MVTEGLAPTVQHRDHADLGTEMFRVRSDDAQRLGCSPEQDAIGAPLVLEADRRNLWRQRKDNVEIGHRQQIVRPRGQPVARDRALTFGAIPVAAGYRRHGLCRRPGSPRHGHRALRCDTVRSRSSRGVRRGPDDRDGPAATPHHGGGRCPPPPVPACRDRVSAAVPPRSQAGRTGSACWQ